LFNLKFEKMKNKMKTMAVIMLMISFAFTSCKKDEAVTAGQDKKIELSNHSQKVLSLIKQFEQKMNSTLKTGDKIHIDSVVWNSEALQNYNYAIPDTSTRDFIVYKASYTLNVNASSMAYVSDVQTLNSQMETDIQNQLESIDTEEAFMRFCDVVLDSIVSNTAYITAINGFGFNLVMGYYPFSPDDNWVWGTLSGTLQGKCDGSMQGVSDGSNEVEWRLNYGSNTWVGGSGGYTNLETKTAYPSQFPDGSGNFRIYLDPTYTLDSCLYNEDLEYFLLEADDIIYTYGSPPTGLRPSGKSFVGIKITDDLFGSQVLAHTYEVTYGIPYQNSPD